MIETENLCLAEFTGERIRAFLESPRRLEAILGVVIPENWPPILELLGDWQRQLMRSPASSGWLDWLFVDKQSRTLVGDGGFKGKPDREGTVEIGYAVLPQYRGRGYATEAVGGLLRLAFVRSSVRRVVALTLPDAAASQRVLAKNGFVYFKADKSAREEQLLRWEIGRRRYLQTN